MNDGKIASCRIVELTKRIENLEAKRNQTTLEWYNDISPPLDCELLTLTRTIFSDGDVMLSYVVQAWAGSDWTLNDRGEETLCWSYLPAPEIWNHE